MESHAGAVTLALHGTRTVERLPDEVTAVATPTFRNGCWRERSRPGGSASDAGADDHSDLSGDRLTAAIVAVVIAIVIGVLIATAITARVKRLRESAARITEGELDEPLEGTGGRDEITDLGKALETMRIALRETFGALSSERDRLAAIFDALTDGVMVVGPDGEVRFSNPAAEPLIEPDGTANELIEPWLIWAEERGAAERDGIRVGRPRLRDRRPQAGGRERGARRHPRPHRGSFAARSPSASSSPTRRMSCGTRSPASRARSRSCAPVPRTTRRRASTSSAGSPRTPSG